MRQYTQIPSSKIETRQGDREIFSVRPCSTLACKTYPNPHKNFANGFFFLFFSSTIEDFLFFCPILRRLLTFALLYIVSEKIISLEELWIPFLSFCFSNLNSAKLHKSEERIIHVVF